MATMAAERGIDPISSLDLPAESLTMVSEMEDGGGPDSLENRPGVFLIGCPNVGKRTLLSRLLLVDIPDIPNLSSGVLCQEWTLETKYYSAELSIWTGHLDEEFSFQKLVPSNKLAALVMVFDMSDKSSFLALKSWVAGIELGKFEILLCIGIKQILFLVIMPMQNIEGIYRSMESLLKILILNFGIMVLMRLKVAAYWGMKIHL